MKDRLIQLFQLKNHWKIKDLEKEMKLSSSKAFVEFIKTLNELEEERFVCNNHNEYFLIGGKDYFVGRAKDISPRNFLVVNGDEKVIVEKKNAPGVFVMDEVLVRRSNDKNEVAKIYTHNIQNVTGQFIKRKNDYIFFSDIDYHVNFVIRNQKEFALSNHVKAVIEIVKYGNPCEGRIIKLLGNIHEKGVDITSILYKNNIRQIFGKKVEMETSKIPAKVSKEDRLNRKDLRDLMTITIDGDDAKDFDDAISIEKEGNGYCLYVHIADVSHYVKLGSAIDQEAYARATSVYVCDRVVPMLPFQLSNGICSLNPNVERCTLTCEMHIDAKGKVKSYAIYPSLIYSDCRCTYNKVNQYLAGIPMKEYSHVTPLLDTLRECTFKLMDQTHKRGSIDFNTKEPKIELDDRGKPVAITCKDRGFSEQMIEECMILANVCVAKELNEKKIPGMFRIHEKPDPEKIDMLMSVCSLMKIPFEVDSENVQTRDIQVMLESIEDEHTRDIISMVALRCMAKARYDEKCLGHFGLSLQEYCHFTSPIRRYPDLIVHRMLRKYLFEHESEKSKAKDEMKCKRQAFHVSQKERDAIQAEREVNDHKMAEFMEKYIGQKFNGTIVSVQNFGFFVELDNTCDGLVSLNNMWDYYEYDELCMRLVGQTSKEVFQIGQQVQVKVLDVDVEKGQVGFSFVKHL
ncbi:MAG: ribonuclease R [Firmicutes bacterium]|nr:ribonuclease R [Bacillota bacterium]